MIALARCGGAVFWSSSYGALFDEAAKTCVAGFDDSSADIREEYATALGELAACCKHVSCQVAIVQVRSHTVTQLPPFSSLLPA